MNEEVTNVTMNHVSAVGFYFQNSFYGKLLVFSAVFFFVTWGILAIKLLLMYRPMHQ